MGQQYAIQAPPTFIKGTGSAGITLTLNTKYDHTETSYVYVYESKTLREVYRAPTQPVYKRLSVIIPNDVFNVGKSYIVKWYKSQGFFAELLAVSTPIEVTDYTTVLDQRVNEQTKKLQNAMFKQEIDFECRISALKEELAQAKAELTKAAENGRKRPREPIATSTISTKERQIFRKYFDEIDTDLDGQISPKELQIHLDSKNIHCNNAAIKKMMEEADLDMNGTLSVDEFILVLYQADESNTSNGWRLAQEQIRAEIAESSPRVRQSASIAADVHVESAKSKAKEALKKTTDEKNAQIKKGKK